MLPNNGCLLCLLGVTVSVLSSVRFSAHTLSGVTLSFLSSVRPDALGIEDGQNKKTLKEVEEENVLATLKKLHLATLNVLPLVYTL
jgi:hypothetical protein